MRSDRGERSETEERLDKKRGACRPLYKRMRSFVDSSSLPQSTEVAKFISRWGELPGDADYRALAKCGIPRDLADRAGLFRVNDEQGAELLGRKRRYGVSYSGLAFPYLMPNGDPANPHVRDPRIRRDTPDQEKRPDGTLKEVGKYLGPVGRGNKLYFPPGTTEAMLRDASLDVLIVEGEKKTLSCARFGQLSGMRLLVVGIPGVDGWRTKRGPIDDLDLIDWTGRKVSILFDLDVETKPSVAGARTRLASHLRSRGAAAWIASLPDGPDKGIDDLLGRVEMENGADASARRFIEILNTAAIDRLADYLAYLPDATYIYRPDGKTHVAKTVNTNFEKVGGMLPSSFLLRHNAINQRSWVPGMPEIIEGKILQDGGGWVRQDDYRIFNLYRPPIVEPGNPQDAGKWVDHIERVYPEDAEHIVKWLAHRVQFPGEKINHALVLGGPQGIGKDTIFDPAKYAVGHCNFADIAPHKLFEGFNKHLQSVILRISEARDMGEARRVDLYNRMKTIIAAPPDTLTINEKHVPEYTIPNVCGVIVTTNYSNGLFLEADDRRHYVAWSERSSSDFSGDYFEELYKWFESGGKEAVAALLQSVRLDDFDAKAPPKKTTAWRRMVDSGRAPEDGELMDALDALGWPEAVTLDAVRGSSSEEFKGFLSDRKNARSIPWRFEAAGYVRVPNPQHQRDGQWRINGKRQIAYAKRELAENARLAAVGRLR